MDEIIIKAFLNGGRGREDNPKVPWTPEGVAQEAVRCYEAGACIVHFHARSPDGGSRYETDWYPQTDGLIRSSCDLVMNHTTARRADVPVEAITRYLLETPNPVEMVSLNMGHGTISNIQWPPLSTLSQGAGPHLHANREQPGTGAAGPQDRNTPELSYKRPYLADAILIRCGRSLSRDSDTRLIALDVLSSIVKSCRSEHLRCKCLGTSSRGGWPQSW